MLRALTHAKDDLSSNKRCGMEKKLDRELTVITSQLLKPEVECHESLLGKINVSLNMEILKKDVRVGVFYADILLSSSRFI